MLMKFYHIITLTDKPPISSSTLIQLHTMLSCSTRKLFAPHCIQDVILILAYVWFRALLNFDLTQEQAGSTQVLMHATKVF